MKKMLTVALTAAAVMIAPAALAQMAPAAPAKTATTSKGPALVDAKGMTLYTFDRDTAAKSNCNGPCAASWPSLAAPANAQPSGDWTVVTRDDGGKQWAHKGKPLYTWINDKKPGDTTGDGVNNNTWHIAKP